MEIVSIIKSKWLLVFIAVIILLVITAVFAKKSVRTEILIPAKAQNIWAVLMDEAGYKNWNPILVPLKGEIENGAKIRYRWKQANGEFIEIESKVIELNENKLLHQRGGTPGILTFDHRYQLFPEDGETRIVQSEVYRGIGVLFWNASQMEPQYQKVNEALRDRISADENDNTE